MRIEPNLQSLKNDYKLLKIIKFYKIQKLTTISINYLLLFENKENSDGEVDSIFSFISSSFI